MAAALASTASEASLAVDETYENGEKALFFNADGSGFAFYPSGKVAACVSKVNAYQNRFYFYENDRTNTLLGSIDENGVGFVQANTGQHQCMVPGCVKFDGEGEPCERYREHVGKNNKCRRCPHSKSEHRAGYKLVLSREGGIINDECGNVTQQWRWDPNAQNAGTPPQGAINVRLNPALAFHFESRDAMSMRFSLDGHKRDMDVGRKFRRTDSYLATATRDPLGAKGKLQPVVATPSLLQRQQQFNTEMRAKASAQNVTSAAIQNADIRGVVAALEEQFAGYAGNSWASACPAPGWREEAMAKTMAELPRMQRTGHETGAVPGLGDTIYVDSSEDAGSTQRAVALRQLGEVELRGLLADENPQLARSRVLNAASGRYSKELNVAGGRAAVAGERLTPVRARELDAYVAAAPADVLVVACCFRADDRDCRHAEIIAQRANQSLDGRPVRMVRVEMAEGGLGYEIQTLPMYLMFWQARLVYAGSLGGKAVRFVPSFQPPHTLLLEPNFRSQIQCEKVLRKERFHWDLAMAVAQVQGGGYDLVLLSEDLPPQERKAVERAVRKPGTVTLVATLVSSASVTMSRHYCSHCSANRRGGPRSVCREGMGCPHCGLVVGSATSTDGGGTMVLRPIKPATLHRLMEMFDRNNGRSRDASDAVAFKGRTVHTMLQAMDQAVADGRKGNFLPRDHTFALTMSAEETEFRGTRLRRA